MKIRFCDKPTNFNALENALNLVEVLNGPNGSGMVEPK